MAGGEPSPHQGHSPSVGAEAGGSRVIIMIPSLSCFWQHCGSEQDATSRCGAHVIGNIIQNNH